jgi:uncharacterized YigZ family protein
LKENITQYATITQKGEAVFTDRGSKFIGIAFPIKTVEDFKQELTAIKKMHAKADHHCFAFRLGTDKNNFRSSDDGEPGGSAGKPILMQIDSLGITYTAVIVIRYFGGTMLGVPGLINAYKTSAALALQVTPIITKSVEVPMVLNFNYTLLNDVMILIKRYQVNIISKDQQLFCRYIVACPKEVDNIFMHEIKKIYGVEIELK